MDLRQIRLVEVTFTKVAAAGDGVVDAFYEELRAFDPALSAAVATGLAAQRRNLLTTIESIIASLRQPDRIFEPAQKLAIRNGEFGALSQQTSFVGNALLRTLKRQLGADYTEEVRDAWIAAYRLLADAMRDTALGPAWRRVA